MTLSTEMLDARPFLMMPVFAVLPRELMVALCPFMSSAPIFSTSGFGPATGPSAVLLPNCTAVLVPVPAMVMPPVKPALFPFRSTLPVELETMVSGELPLTGELTLRLLAEALIHACVPPSTRPVVPFVVLMVTAAVPVCMFRLLFSVRIFAPPMVTGLVEVELKIN